MQQASQPRSFLVGAKCSQLQVSLAQTQSTASKGRGVGRASSIMSNKTMMLLLSSDGPAVRQLKRRLMG